MCHSCCLNKKNKEEININLTPNDNNMQLKIQREVKSNSAVKNVQPYKEDHCEIQKKWL